MTTLALLPYQQKWSADKSAVKVWEKSRRIGASWDDASDSALTASASAKAGGMNCFYIGYNKDMAREYIDDCAFWAKKFDLAGESVEEFVFTDQDKDIQSFRVKFASGFKIEALSSRPTNLRGKQGKVTIDEAAFHEDLPGLLKAAMAFLVWGGRVCVISSHNGDASPFNELVKDIRAGKKKYALHRTTFDDALAQGLYKRICQKLKKEWTPENEAEWRTEIFDYYADDAEEELNCVPAHGGGAYLHRALIEKCMTENSPVIRLSLPPEFAQQSDDTRVSEISAWLEENLKEPLDALDKNLLSSFGMDFGRTGDLSSIAPVQEQKNLKAHVPFIVELRNVPFKQQEQILFYILGRLPRFISGAMDARGNGQYLAEVTAQKFGYQRVEQVMLTQNWYMENMPPFKAAFEDMKISLPTDADVLADLRMIRMTKGIAKIPEDKKNRGTDGKDRHGDSAVALALAYYASRREAAPIEFASVRGERMSGQAFNEDGWPQTAGINKDTGFGTAPGGIDTGGF